MQPFDVGVDVAIVHYHCQTAQKLGVYVRFSTYTLNSVYSFICGNRVRGDKIWTIAIISMICTRALIAMSILASMHFKSFWNVSRRRTQYDPASLSGLLFLT